MQKIILVLGMPGSGKTTYIKNRFKDYVFFDDYNKGSNHHRIFIESIFYKELKEAIQSEKNIVMTDIGWCIPERLLETQQGLKEILHSLNRKILFDYVYFENNPELCKKNVLHRNRIGKTKHEFELIDKLSNVYIIPKDEPIIQVKDYSRN